MIQDAARGRALRGMLLAVLLALTCLVAWPKQAVAVSGNLLEGKEVTASNEYSTMPKENLVDGNDSTRWSTEAAPTQWAYVDMGEPQSIMRFRILWESDTVYASAYKIYVSDSTEDWGNPVVEVTGNKKRECVDVLDEPVKGRYVRLEVTEQAGYQSVSACEFQAFATAAPDPSEQDPEENIALGKAAAADSSEADTLGAANAFDGNTTDMSSRWASKVDADPNNNGGPHWIYVDLGAEYNVKTVRLYWEMRKANGYHIDIATGDTAPAEDSNDWQRVYTNKGRPASKTDTITLDKVYKARFVRLYIDQNTYDDPDGGTAWGNVSIYEMEVYGGAPAVNIDDVAAMISVVQPNKGDEKLTVNMPQIDGYTIEYRGTDYEQVVDADLNINAPLVDKEVKLAFKVTDDKSGNYTLTEVPVTIPGSEAQENTGNKAPAILPELAEWLGGEGTFTAGEGTRIVYTDASLKNVVELFASDLSEVTGTSFTAVQGSADTKNAVVFTTSDDADLVALGEEGYTLQITADRALVTASVKSGKGGWDATTGANWGAQTLLQAFEQGNGSMPQGEARDYPLYKVRGIILDVGRKTFTMDWLKQLAREMAYYKMNDLNVHLNDNFIGIETYVNEGIDPADLEKGAYSGFRMESDIKEGNTYDFAGTKLTARTDLTSKDLSYTKKEFADFINSCGELGVNISPEIDMPAHSLAFSKVFPDLSYGVMQYRNRDHLDILNQYDAVLAMAETVWDEYTTDGGAFSGARYINIGADEYNVSGTGDHAPNGTNVQDSGTAYRRFVNDLSSHMLDEGYTPRVWGSLSNYAGDNSIIKNADQAQVLLWNAGYAHMDEMYDMGYQLINCDDGKYYIVPGATYYYDYLNADIMYNNPINVQNITVPAGDPQMVGGMYAAWNDMIDKNDLGISEYDVYDRLNQSMGLYAAKVWGKDADAMSLSDAQQVVSDLGDAPGVNMGYKQTANEDGTYVQLGMDDTKDASGMGRDIAKLSNATIEDLGYTSALKLNGGESYAAFNGIETLGLDSSLRVKVMRTSASSDAQVLFESDYGKIMAVQEGTGKVGVTREGYNYSFNYTLPVGTWVELEFKNTQNSISLFVNGKLVDTIGNSTRGQEYATVMFPLARVGSTENAFEGYVDDVIATSSSDISTSAYASTGELMQAIQRAHALADQNGDLAALVKQGHSLLGQVNPDASEVASVIDQINAAIGSMEYEVADYSRVDAYLAIIPKDLSLFTDESAAALTEAVGLVQRNLPAAMQDTVDGYERGLVLALDGLKVKEARDLSYIDVASLTASACSQQSTGGSEGPASNVLDGNTSTIWHTNYSGGDTCANNQHWIQLASSDGSTMTVAGLEYTPRAGGTNGTVLGYQIQALEADGSWKTVATGTWAQNDSTKNVTFDAPVKTTAVRLVVTSSVGGFGSAAEMRLIDGAVSADVDGLNALIEQASGLTKSAYASDGWKAMSDALAAAQELASAENPDANEVESAKSALADAMTNLRLTARVNKDGLAAAVDNAAKLREDDYTAKSWKALQDALDTARSVLDNQAATQDEVDDALAQLQDALEALEPAVPEPEAPDTSGLSHAIANASGLDKSKYTSESWKAFQDALDAARAVLDDPNATQDEVDAALKKLESAQKALVKAPEQTPGQGGSGDQTSGGQEGADNGNSGDGLVSTGDPVTLLFLATGGAGAALAGLGYAVRRRKTH